MLLPTAGLISIGMGSLTVIVYGKAFLPLMIFAAFTGFIIAVMRLSAPQSISIQGNALVIYYPFNEKRLFADEISSIGLIPQTRNSGPFGPFVALNLLNRRTVRIFGLDPNLPTAYLVFKNWHKENASTRQTIEFN